MLEVTVLQAILSARHHLSRGELDAAEKILEGRQDPDALHILGQVELRRGRLDAAERLLRRAIERDPAAAVYHNDLGNLLQDRGKLAEAIASYRRALRLHPGFAEAWNDLGTARYAKGELEGALECYRQAVRLRPDHLVAHANLGAVCRKLGLLADARRAFQRELVLRIKQRFWRISLDPVKAQLDAGNVRHAIEIARLKNNQKMLAMAYLRQGKPAEALEAARAAGDAYLADRAAAEQALRCGDFAAAEPLLRRALEARPREAALHLGLGQALQRRRAMAEAESAYRRALELDPLSLRARVRLAELMVENGRAEQAEAAALAAMEIDDNFAAAHVVLGMANKARGRAKKARECFERALELDPHHPQAVQQLATALRDDDRLDEAEARLRAALRARPDEPGLLTDLAMILADQMRYDDALQLFDRALAIAPGFIPAINRKALLLDHLGHSAQGLELLREALRLAPGDEHAQYNLALHQLKHGEFAEGWQGYERRRGFESFIGRYRRFPLPEWDGGPLKNRVVLVLPEQGLGDEIMFGSCVPDLAAEARHVILECDPKLEAIFRRSFPGSTVVSRMRTVANDWITRVEPRPEVQLSAGSLARRYRRSPADFPQRAFLKGDSKSIESWKTRLDALGPGRKIGLSWRGGVGITGQKRRSLTLEKLLPVLRLPGLHWVNLQYTEVGAEIQACPVKVHHWQEAIDDYDQTAALVCALDGVLTVCTALVHLTGGLGRPALVMVPFGADWRYGATGERMVWYPTVRLIRQREVGQWDDVLQEVSRRIASNTFS